MGGDFPGHRPGSAPAAGGHDKPSGRGHKGIERRRTIPMVKQYLLASDFDQTLSFNDSGVALSELIGFHGFHDKVKGLSEMNLVQQGAELSYLILHDPDFRRVRKDHLIETGKRIRFKHNVALFAKALDN